MISPNLTLQGDFTPTGDRTTLSKHSMFRPVIQQGRAVGQEVIRLSFTNAWELFKTVRKRQEGQTMTEYAIVLALVAVIVIAGVTALGTHINTVLNNVVSKF